MAEMKCKGTQARSDGGINESRARQGHLRAEDRPTGQSW